MVYSSSLPTAAVADADLNPAPNMPPPAGAIPEWKHNQPIFRFAMGGSYSTTNITDVAGGVSNPLWGWYLAPTVQATRYIGARFDLQQDYDTKYNVTQRVRFLRATAGPVFTYPLPFIKKFTTPFIYTEGGATRVSAPLLDGTLNQYTPWQATVDAGFGLQVPLSRRIGFQIIPGEYSTFKQDNSKWQGSYSAKAGFVLNFYGER